MAQDPKHEAVSWVQAGVKLALFALRHRAWRRKLMFYISLGAMLQLALGLVVLDELTRHWVLFVLFWSFCLLLVLTMILLAAYDMLAIRAEQRLALLRLRQEMLEEAQDRLASQENDDSRDH